MLISCHTNFINTVRFEVFMVVTMKNVIFWDVTLCGSCKNQCSSKTSVLTKATQHNIPEDGNFLLTLLSFLCLIHCMSQFYMPGWRKRNITVQNSQIWQIQETLLCTLPCVTAEWAAIGHPVSLAHIILMTILIFHSVTL
jgi:hypothetical protein